MTYSEFVERTISVLEQIDQLADIAERSSNICQLVNLFKDTD